MKTDRELLELAAKAAGLSVGLALGEHEGQSCLFIQGQDKPWNPLTDDGAALRLALTLGLSFEPYPLYSTEKHSVIVKQRRRSDQLRESNPTECIERYKGDPMGATRRAIVRAAASIGEAMQ